MKKSKKLLLRMLNGKSTQKQKTNGHSTPRYLDTSEHRFSIIVLLFDTSVLKPLGCTLCSYIISLDPHLPVLTRISLIVIILILIF
jgi:hypothetical protein